MSNYQVFKFAKTLIFLWLCLKEKFADFGNTQKIKLLANFKNLLFFSLCCIFFCCMQFFQSKVEWSHQSRLALKFDPNLAKSEKRKKWKRHEKSAKMNLQLFGSCWFSKSDSFRFYCLNENTNIFSWLLKTHKRTFLFTLNMSCPHVIRMTCYYDNKRLSFSLKKQILNFF